MNPLNANKQTIPIKSTNISNTLIIFFFFFLLLIFFNNAHIPAIIPKNTATTRVNLRPKVLKLNSSIAIPNKIPAISNRFNFIFLVAVSAVSLLTFLLTSFFFFMLTSNYFINNS